MAIVAICQGLPLLASCGSSPPSIVAPQMDGTNSPLPSDSFYCPDEYLKWTIRWKGIEAASTEMVTGQAGEIGGKAAIIVYSRSQSSELANIFRDVRDELTSRVSLITGRPLSNESTLTEEGASELLQVKFGSEGYNASLRDGDESGAWTISSEGAVVDMHSFVARLRFWDGLPASGVRILMQSGRRHYRVDLAKGGQEVISTPMGQQTAIRIHGLATRLRFDGKQVVQAEERTFTVWRSEDGRYLPLRFETETRLGKVRGTLVDVRQPETDRCIHVKEI